ncbi:MAG: phospholipase D-like domain-containing protein [Saprospiraceae bacterium]
MNWTSNIVDIVRAGKNYFEKLISLINESTESIHLQAYIFDDDETGILVVEALKAAVKRNVKVYFLADGYASQIMSKKFINELTNAGINFRFFDPIFKTPHFYFGRRMHQKVFVADARCALVGGINVANRYNDMPDKCAWLDFSLFVEGEAARELCILCWKTWNNFHLEAGLTPCEENIKPFDFSGKQTFQVLMRRNDWVRGKDEISATYREMLRNARSHVTIMCSYFIPGKLFRQELQNASRRGVKITVITAGPSDILLAKIAERWLYDWLIRNKIELYEYQTSILHAKLAVCDSEWLTIGSYNVNDISAFASIELNLNVRGSAFASKMEDVIKAIISKECIRITEAKNLKSKNLAKQFGRWLSYHVYLTTFKLMTLYFQQEKI